MDDKVTDRRVQRTRQLLLDALNVLIVEKGYEAMTVQDVIDRANVGRSTFYAHFQDKEDLLLKAVETLWADLEAHLKNVRTEGEIVWNLSLSMFQHAQSQRPLYKALIGKQGGNVAMKHIQKQLYVVVFEHLRLALSRNNTNFPPEILTQHVVNSFISLLTWWLDNNANYTAEQMNNFYRQLVLRGIEGLL
jgi:AcrR family transcriptional regulator